MRTNIVIDDNIMQAAMRGSEFKTKKEAVEAGLKLLARQNHCREVLKWEGKLHWDDQPQSADSAVTDNMVMENIKPYRAEQSVIRDAKKGMPRKSAQRKIVGAV
jgi:antitoxin ParD1/3/4